MTKMKVYEIPEPVLRQQAQEVPAVTQEIQQILSDMLETMYATNGVGLAGNQVGLLKRLVVIDCANKDEVPEPIKMVNPKIIAHSEEKVLHNEGCLSIPKEYADVERWAEVTVQYLDENGQLTTKHGTDLLAIAFQHELDHLDGVLFIDHISKLKRDKMIKHLEKRRKRESEDE